MNILSISTKRGTQHSYIADPAEATACCDKLKEAMRGFRPYKNDTQETVTIIATGIEYTVVVEELVAVSVEFMGQSEETIIEREVFRRRLESKIAARLAPAEPIKTSD